jgi:hypothetical protein
MRYLDHDVTNLRALDRSGNDNHATFGDGATSTTYPTKLVKEIGYSFDGGDYLQTRELGLSTLSTITTAALIKIASTNNQALICFENGIGSDIGVLMYYSTARGFEFFCGSPVASNAARGGANAGFFNQYVSFIGIHDGTDTIIYLNGERMTDASTPIPPNNAAASDVTIGARGNGTSDAVVNDGQVLQFSMYDFALTQTQVYALHQRMFDDYMRYDE